MTNTTLKRAGRTLLMIALLLAGAYALVIDSEEAQAQAAPSCNFVEIQGIESQECVYAWASHWLQQPSFEASTTNGQAELQARMVYNIPVGQTIFGSTRVTKATVSLSFNVGNTKNSVQEPPAPTDSNPNPPESVTRGRKTLELTSNVSASGGGIRHEIVFKTETTVNGAVTTREHWATNPQRTLDIEASFFTDGVEFPSDCAASTNSDHWRFTAMRSLETGGQATYRVADNILELCVGTTHLPDDYGLYMTQVCADDGNCAVPMAVSGRLNPLGLRIFPSYRNVASNFDALADKMRGFTYTNAPGEETKTTYYISYRTGEAYHGSTTILQYAERIHWPKTSRPGTNYVVFEPSLMQQWEGYDMAEIFSEANGFTGDDAYNTNRYRPKGNYDRSQEARPNHYALVTACSSGTREARNSEHEIRIDRTLGTCDPPRLTRMHRLETAIPSPGRAPALMPFTQAQDSVGGL